jgi:hypothetical protein
VLVLLALSLLGAVSACAEAEVRSLWVTGKDRDHFDRIQSRQKAGKVSKEGEKKQKKSLFFFCGLGGHGDFNPRPTECMGGA